MGKVIKILIHILSTFILTLIIIPVLLSLLLHLPTVQNFAIHKTTDFISNKLETTVSIDRIGIRLFNRVVIDGLYVADYAADTLLYAKKLSVDVNQYGLFKGELALGAVKLDSTKFYLRQMDSGISNLSEILSKLKSDKPKSEGSFAMSVSSLNIDDLSFSFRKLKPRKNEYGVNFDDLSIENFALDVSKISIIDDSINMTINNMALKDKSGFQVNSLCSNKFSISSKGLLFNRLKIDTPDSKLEADFLYFTYPAWSAYSEFLTDVTIDAKIVNSTVSYATIAYFAPSLRSWQSIYTNISANVRGTVNAMTGNIEELRMNDTELSVKFGLYGIPDIKNTRFAININKLRTNIDDVDLIIKDITKKSIKDGNKMLGNIGNVDLTGTFDGLLSSFKSDAMLVTDIGNVKLNMNFLPDKSYKSAFAGDIEVLGVNIGKLLNNNQLGRVVLKANVDGKFGNQAMTANTIATLSEFEFNGYKYHDIALNGLINQRTFEGAITSHDPNIKFDFNGLLNFNDTIPKFDFDLALFNADLHKLNLNKRDSISLISCDLKATAQGTNMDNINGVININNMLYVNHVDSVSTGEITLVGDNDAAHKSLALHSSFADIQFKSRLSYKHMFNYLKSVLEEYLPMLTSSDPSTAMAPLSSGSTADLAGYSLLQIDVKQANNVAGIFLPGLQLAQGTKLSFMFNPDARKFSLSASSDYIESGNFFLSKLNVNSRNQADSLSLFVRADDVYVGGMYMPNFSVIGGARNNRFNLSTKFSDPKTGVSALIGATASLGKDPVSGIPQVNIGLTPSTFTSNNRTWRVTARNIVYDTTKISINSFRILSSGQELSINGIASRSATDTLHVKLKDFDLAPFSQLTDRAGYKISGITNGRADIASTLNGPSVYAHISLDSMMINKVAVPPTLFVSTWDFHTERAKFTVTTKGSDEPVVLGYYRPNQGQYLVNINLRDIDLSLIDPVLSSVLNNTSGSADTKLTLTGTKSQPSVNGYITVKELGTTVSYTNVPYTLKNATIDVVNNDFTLKPSRVFDKNGHSAELEMTLGSRYFSNLHYDIKIRPHNLMVINTTLADNDLFYGTIYASGAAQIKGDKRGINMDIVATTDDNSTFYMPLSGKSNISEADFIVFDSPQLKNVDSTNYLVRKRMMFERKNKAFSSTKSNMNINMALTVKPNTDFQLVIDPTVGDILKGRGNGLLNIHINPNDNVFSMYGDYQITEGSYLFTLQNIINKKFVIQQGSTIKWTGEPLDALLDITAIYKLKASLAPLLNSNDDNLSRNVPVDCQIHFAERLSQPAITFDVTVQNVDPETQSLVANALNTQEMMATQFFWLLAVNSFYADSGGSGMNIGAMGGSVTGFEFLSNQLSNWVSSDKYDIGIRYRPKGELNSDELDIGLSTAIIDNRLLLEVEGNYDFGNNTAMNNRTANSLTGDFYLTWLIDRAGNLKAKAFSRTIDRFDENQGLQENGIGIYYKEDFNSFKDIITNIKDRFKKKTKTK